MIISDFFLLFFHELVIDCGRPEVASTADLITPTVTALGPYDNNGVFTVGSEVKLKCKPGHKYIAGSETRKCTKESRWDGTTIECKCKCNFWRAN